MQRTTLCSRVSSLPCCAIDEEAMAPYAGTRQRELAGAAPGDLATDAVRAQAAAADGSRYCSAGRICG